MSHKGPRAVVNGETKNLVAMENTPNLHRPLRSMEPTKPCTSEILKDLLTGALSEVLDKAVVLPFILGNEMTVVREMNFSGRNKGV